MAGESVTLLSAVIAADGRTMTLLWDNIEISDGIGVLSSTISAAHVDVDGREDDIALASVDSLVANFSDTGWVETLTLAGPVFAGESATWFSSLGHTYDDKAPPHRSAATSAAAITNNSTVEAPPVSGDAPRSRKRFRGRGWGIR